MSAKRPRSILIRRPRMSATHRNAQHLRKRHYSPPFGYSTPTTAGASATELQSAQGYCSDLLQKYDSPSSTLSAFIPPAARSLYTALRAFNLETSRIADSVSTTSVGALRYQFWRDNVNRAFAGTPPKQPVSILLAHGLADLDARTGGSAKMTKGWFMRIIAAREQYGNGTPYPTLDVLEKYAENTYSTLLYMTLQALPMSSLTADHVASHVGKATGITVVLRGLPLVAFPPPINHHSNSAGLGGDALSRQRHSQGQVTLPLDVMANAGLKDEDVLRKGADAPGLRDAVFEVATRASDHLITARQMLKNVKAGEDVGHKFEYEGEEGHEYGSSASKSAKPKEEVERGFGALMPAVATDLWLNRLQKYDFDVFREELRRREWKLPYKAYLAHRRKMF